MTFVQIAAKMIGNDAIQEAMQLLGISGQSSAVATALSAGKAIEAAYRPAAVAASIVSYGAAAAVGATAFEAAMATAQIGLAEGGIVPGRPSSRDNVLLPMATGEGVVKASSVQHYGAHVIHSLNNRTFLGRGFAGGGIIGSSSVMSGAVGRRI